MIKKVIKYFEKFKKILIFKRLFKYKRLSNEDILRDIWLKKKKTRNYRILVKKSLFDVFEN